MYIYYQPTEYPTHHLTGLYMPGGNRKNPNGPKNPGRIEINGKYYLIIRDPKKPRTHSLKEIK